VVEVLILTEEFAVDLESCFTLGEADRPVFPTSNRCIPAKNTVGWSAVVFCAYEVVELLSVVSHFVRGVHKFHL